MVKLSFLICVLVNILHLLYKLLKVVSGELAHTELHGKVNVAILHNIFFYSRGCLGSQQDTSALIASTFGLRNLCKIFAFYSPMSSLHVSWVGSHLWCLTLWNSV